MRHISAKFRAFAQPGRRLLTLLGHRRGAVSLLAAVSFPAAGVAAGVGVEVALWSINATKLQRAADAASTAGARVFNAMTSEQSAANLAADVAELNGATGGTRVWNAGTRTLTSGNITVTLGAGVMNASNTSVTVTLTKYIAPAFTGFLNVGGRTVSAVATADAMVSTLTDEACLLALDTSGGTATNTVNVSGSGVVNFYGCSLRSNASINITGSSTVNTSSVYAAGNIALTSSSRLVAGKIAAAAVTSSGSSSYSGTRIAAAEVIADPYVNSARLNAAIGQLGTAGGTALTIGSSSTTTISPGIWTSWTINSSARVTLNPGLYVIKGPVNVSGSARLTGTGVTIVHSGDISLGGSTELNLVAAGISPVGAAVPGVLFASRTASTVTFTGSDKMLLTGVIYYPSSNVTWSGSVASDARACLEVIGSRVTITGSSKFAANCASYGALSLTTGTPAREKLAR